GGQAGVEDQVPAGDGAAEVVGHPLQERALTVGLVLHEVDVPLGSAGLPGTALDDHALLRKRRGRGEGTLGRDHRRVAAGRQQQQCGGKQRPPSRPHPAAHYAVQYARFWTGLMGLGVIRRPLGPGVVLAVAWAVWGALAT